MAKWNDGTKWNSGANWNTVAEVFKLLKTVGKRIQAKAISRGNNK